MRVLDGRKGGKLLRELGIKILKISCEGCDWKKEGDAVVWRDRPKIVYILLRRVPLRIAWRRLLARKQLVDALSGEKAYCQIFQLGESQLSETFSCRSGERTKARR